MAVFEKCPWRDPACSVPADYLSLADQSSVLTMVTFRYRRPLLIAVPRSLLAAVGLLATVGVSALVATDPSLRLSIGDLPAATALVAAGSGLTIVLSRCVVASAWISYDGSLRVRNPWRTYKVELQAARLDDAEGPEVIIASGKRIRVWVGQPLYSTYRPDVRVTASFRQFMSEIEALRSTLGP
jgi:hypothetical protein